ncbi:TadE family protein [Desulfarculus baarsii DSM 2075]|uniref:TadE family protein n=1 Tax=Desulfarculus baarsii (strain ATCC 33931 / DSM 2075 / LMG 7858 / VKM B-1802 / 2st14) TaxID=644282 RepID=E1QL91_DESB2|nr:TadE/TadG family type IV pilus assembly protein [Desulfarculus baarsii]ADK85356.1 TadE family protein [Desulfarculus baarsii DSM 2075]
MRPFRRLAADGRGSVAVEFALFLPVFLLVIFSIIELGAAWYQKQMLVNASREGARLGALFSTSGGLTAQEVQERVNQYLSDSGFPSQAVVQAVGVDGASGDPVTVNVSADYEFPVLSAFIGAVPGTISLSATTVMRHE